MVNKAKLEIPASLVRKSQFEEEACKALKRIVQRAVQQQNLSRAEAEARVLLALSTFGGEV